MVNAGDPLRPVLAQLTVRSAETLLQLAAGQHGAISAVLGGLVSFAAGLGFATVASASRKDSAGLAMLAALRAEAVKIFLVVALLWIVLTVYQNVVIVAFIGTFIVTTIVFALALFVRE